MDPEQINKVASTALFESYLKKWGGQVSLLVSKTGSVSLQPTGPTPLPQEAHDEFPGLVKLARLRWRFTREIKPANADHWELPDGNVLEAYEKYSNWKTKIEKFSWNPVTGELLLIKPGQQHATVTGKAPFDDYVRGIILRNPKTVTTRPFYPAWAQRDSDVDPEELKMLSFEAQHAVKEALEHNGIHGWNYQFDINNRMLQQQTGIMRW